jgi:hypothetical protein
MSNSTDKTVFEETNRLAQVKDYAGIGTLAATFLYDHWKDRDDWNELLAWQYEPEFARAFIDQFSKMQTERAASVDGVGLRRADEFASQLASDKYRGILEVLQNAEDESATKLTVVMSDNYF